MSSPFTLHVAVLSFAYWFAACSTNVIFSVICFKWCDSFLSALLGLTERPQTNESFGVGVDEIIAMHALLAPPAFCNRFFLVRIL